MLLLVFSGSETREFLYPFLHFHLSHPDHGHVERRSGACVCARLRLLTLDPVLRVWSWCNRWPFGIGVSCLMSPQREREESMETMLLCQNDLLYGPSLGNTSNWCHGEIIWHTSWKSGDSLCVFDVDTICVTVAVRRYCAVWCYLSAVHKLNSTALNQRESWSTSTSDAASALIWA